MLTPQKFILPSQELFAPRTPDAHKGLHHKGIVLQLTKLPEAFVQSVL